MKSTIHIIKTVLLEVARSRCSYPPPRGKAATNWKWLAVVAAAMTFTAVNAGERTFDFEGEDPLDAFDISSPLETWSEASDFEYTGTGNPGEFFILNNAVNSETTVAIFPDIDNGKLVKAFTLTADVRTGNGSHSSGRAADGFSVNYVRADDPVLDGSYSLPGPAENGTRTGVSVSFDTWDGNALNDGGTVGRGGANGSGDHEGIIVQVDGTTIGGVELLTRNGACEDITSLQTGPQTSNDDDVKDKYPLLGDLGGNPDSLCWQPLEVSMTETGLLTVKWKNNTVLDDFQTSYFPSPGQLVLAGRTGDANAIVHFDNIKLTTVLADKALLSGLTSTANGFTVSFRDVGSSRIAQDSVVLTLDGTAVDAANVSVSKDGEITTATYTHPTFFESESTHEVGITARDTDGGQIEQTTSFTVPQFVKVSAAHNLEGNFSQRGFKMRVLQAQSGLVNQTHRHEQHLAGQITDNAGNPIENLVDHVDHEPDANGYVDITGVINFDQDAGAQGVFREGGSGNNEATDVPDDLIPGIPGTSDSTDQITAEILAVVEIPEAGLYNFVFNSDDGFRTTAGQTSDILEAVELGVFSDGRGASSTFYKVLFEEAGFYKLRNIWYEGGGGANLEWWTADLDGNPIALLNDSENGGLKTYRNNIPEDPASVVWFTPIRTGATRETRNVLPNATGVAADSSITAVIRNGTTSVDADSITLMLNGQTVTPEVSTSGGDTTVTYTPDGIYPAGSTQSVELGFTHAGTAESRSWTFTVADYDTLDCATGMALGSGTTRGFNFFTHQAATGHGTTIQGAEQRLVDRDNVTNGADPASGTIDGVINFAADDSGEPVPVGNFQDRGDDSTLDNPDDYIPGIPGTEGEDPTNNIVSEFTTYLEFPEAGYYRMGVNSDDGFTVRNAESGSFLDDPETPDVNEAVEGALEGGFFNGGRGAADTLFGFAVPVAGVYPMRLLWYEGGGGANVEWFTIAPDGTRRLVNSEGGIKAFRTRSTGAANALECPVAGGAISVARNADGTVIITYEGTLHSSDSVTGTFEPVAGATSPHTVQTSGSAQFYIAR